MRFVRRQIEYRSLRQQTCINKLYGGVEMNFTKKLFEMTSMALPDVTARTFSAYLGKSEGYYGSISAQNLNISTNSLLYLSEVLEHKRVTSPNQYITEIQQMIALEVARRVQSFPMQNMEVRKIMLRAIANAYAQSTGGYSAPPIVIA
jgi:hypothetical protein